MSSVVDENLVQESNSLEPEDRTEKVSGCQGHRMGRVISLENLAYRTSVNSKRPPFCYLTIYSVGKLWSYIFSPERFRLQISVQSETGLNGLVHLSPCIDLPVWYVFGRYVCLR